MLVAHHGRRREPHGVQKGAGVGLGHWLVCMALGRVSTLTMLPFTVLNHSDENDAGEIYHRPAVVAGKLGWLSEVEVSVWQDAYARHLVLDGFLPVQRSPLASLPALLCRYGRDRCSRSMSTYDERVRCTGGSVFLI